MISDISDKVKGAADKIKDIANKAGKVAEEIPKVAKAIGDLAKGDKPKNMEEGLEKAVVTGAVVAESAGKIKDTVSKLTQK